MDVRIERRAEIFRGELDIFFGFSLIYSIIAIRFMNYNKLSMELNC